MDNDGTAPRNQVDDIRAVVVILLAALTLGEEKYSAMSKQGLVILHGSLLDCLQMGGVSCYVKRRLAIYRGGK